MKKYLVTLSMVIGLGVTAYGQGTIIFGNYQNSNPSQSATSGGLVFTNSGGHIGLLGDNVSFTIWAGADMGSLLPVGTYQGSGGTWFDYGQFSDPSLATKTINTIPAKSTGAFEIQMWYDPAGIFNTYSNAVASGTALTGQVQFLNSTGGGPTPPSTFGSMPALMLTSVPEPATFAMVGLGSAALLIFRRRRIK